ncbi:MAG: HAD family hydrolase [Chloroflexi bacterium]|nr:MAG: HAD family hydrolase [Chloroflexota bacterium]
MGRTVVTITAITFDFWQTLYKNQPIDHNARLQALKDDVERGSGAQFSMDQIKAAVDVARQTWTDTWAQQHRTLPAAEWISVLLDALDVTVPPEHHRAIQQRMETSILDVPPMPVEEAPAVLAQLAGNYRLAVISDTGITPGRVLRQILENDNLLQYFDHLTFSDELGRSKPHRQAFEATLAALNAQPAQAVHVGDLLRTDVAGAQGVGMRAVQYVGVTRDDGAMARISSHHPPAPNITPDAVIKNHTELLPLLHQWNNRG